MRVYNTMTRTKEEFKPISSECVTIYSCGPTVYNYAHIGNMRTYVFMDILRRVLKLNGYKLKHVMNITDVGHLTSDGDEGEDKMEKAAKSQKKTPWEIAEYFTGVFFKDLERLNIETPEITPKATAHINEMIEFVQELCDKGYGYETSDGIYFDIAKFPHYGRLSRVNLEDQLAGASERVEINTEKRHPADFAIWKKAPKEHIMQWPSPWGMGYPGWHIECSTMSREYLGDCFDIHTGGVDHIPIHHENEIAQSEAITGKKSVHYWMHGEFLLVDNGQMSNSLGNTYTISDLMEKGYSPLAYRYFCLNGNYRNKLNFTWEAMDAAQVSLNRLYEALARHKEAGEGILPESTLAEWKKEFTDAVSDDLNVPLGLGILWKALRYPEKSRSIYEFALFTDRVLGLSMEENAGTIKESDPPQEEEISSEVRTLVEQRTEAKKRKDFNTADAIRDQLRGMGITLIDTKDGVKIVRESNAR